MATETTAVTPHSRDAPSKRAWSAGAILAALALGALLSAATWVPVTWYLATTSAPCDSPGSFAYEPGKIAASLLAVMLKV